LIQPVKEQTLLLAHRLNLPLAPFNLLLHLADFLFMDLNIALCLALLRPRLNNPQAD
jgi:hypothetical protein